MKNLDIIILCGGKGERLSGVIQDRPKSMVQIHDRPFLDIILDKFKKAGLNRFILATGHMSDHIERYYKKEKNDARIIISKEKFPVGTGGAVKNAEKFVKSDHAFVLNGDSYCDIDLEDFYSSHISNNALVSLATTKLDDRSDTGKILIDEKTHMIMKFMEKQEFPTLHISTGIYLFSKPAFAMLPEGKNISLETEFFPALTGRNLYAYLT